MTIKVSVIIILYNSIPQLSQYLHLQSWNSYLNLIFVDNTPERDLSLRGDNIFYIPLFANKGIAYAQNIGVHKAISLESEFVIFFDQDSVIEPKYIDNIVQEYIRVESEINNLFLLGPTVIYEKTEEEYKSVMHKYKQAIEGFEIRREIISSGSCTRLKKIQKIGLLDEKLFIDHVDTEWCWRANMLGYKSGITKKIILRHNIGQRIIKIGAYMIIISAPHRYYYQCRNYLWLCRENYTPIQWKINNGIKIFLRLFYFPFVLKDGIQITKYMYKGLYDGIKK